MLLVPRTKAHLARTLAAVRNATHTPVQGLALSHAVTHPTSLPFRATGLILTSTQALKSLAHFPTHLPTYCVGPTTARAARQKGLAVLHTAPTATALAMYLNTLPRQTFFHPKAANATPLNLPHHTYLAVTAYTTHYIEKVPSHTLHQLRHTPPSGVLLFSPKSAQTVAQLLTLHQLPAPKTAYCLSPEVAKAWPYHNTQIAACPTLEAMLDLLP